MNKRLLNLILLFSFLLLSGTAYAQAVSMTAATTGLAPAAQVSGTNDIAILGVQLTKAAGGGNTVTTITVAMTPTPVGKFTTARLFKSTNASFDGVGSETLIATGTITATDITFTGSPLTNFDGATSLADDEYLFVVVNVDPAAATGSTTTPSLVSTNVIVSTGTTSGSTITGATYTLTAPQISIANVTNSLAAIPLIAGATTQPVFGFSLTSTGTQNVSAITVNVTSTAVGKWGSYTLWQSDDNDFATAGNNTNAGGSFDPSSGTTIVITGLNQNITTTTKYYFLTVNVDNGVNGATATILPSLANTGITSTPATGTYTGSAAGPAAAYAFAPRLTIANLSTGLAANPLVAGTSGQAVFGFSLVSSSSQTVTTLNVQLTNTTNPTDKWTNYKVYRSADASYATPGDNVEITTAVITPSSNQIQIGSLTEAITTTGTNYFLVVDINPAVTSATSTIEPSLAPANITITTGGGIASGTATGTNYSFTGATATFAPVTGGVSPSPLLAGTTNHAVLGFSAVSNATQTFTALNVQVTSNPSGKWTSYSLVRSVDADFATAGDNTTIGSLTITPSPTQIAITGLNETLNGVAKNYFLVVTADPTVTATTPAIVPSFTEANVTAGNVAAVTITGISYTFNTSQSSDIVLNGSTTASIAYETAQDSPITGFPDGSVNLANYIIRDGGGSADGDDKSTTVTAISLQITNSENLRQIVLYDNSTNTEIPGTQQAVTGTGTVTIAFSPTTPITVPDGGTFEFKVRASFEQLVTDNHAIQVSIASVTGTTTGSRFSAIGTWASTQTASNTNVIAVVASKFIVDFNVTTQAINQPFTITVRAVDDVFENVDLDYTGKIDLQRSPGGGSFTAAQSFTGRSLAAGVVTWTNAIFTVSNNYTITANDNAYDPPAPENQVNLENGQKSIVITASSSGLTLATDPVLCYGAASSSELLSNIVITETDPAGISGSNGSYTFSLALPSGFVFDQSVTSGVSVGGGSDLSAPSGYTYPSANIVQFSFTLNGTANTNSITISGLRAQHPHPGGASPAPTGVLNITRLGGTANIAGVGVGTVLGSISALQNNPAVNFTVSATVGNIDENTTSFNVSSPPVNLIGTGTPAGVFSGSGVTPGPYRFNPNTLSQGNYDITYLQTSANGCQSQAVKNFTVFDSGIGGLNATYCSNNDPSNTFTVSQTFIDNIFGTGWTLDHYTYYDPFLYAFSLPAPSNATIGATFINNGQTFTVVQTLISGTYLLCSGTGTPLSSGTLTRTSGSGDLLINYSYYYIGDFRPITSPDNTRFDPKLPAYQPIYNYFGGQIPIGFAVCNGGSVPCDGNSNYGTFSTYQWVTVRAAPTASFTLPSDVYTFCNDNGAVTLIGSPPNGTNATADEFSTEDANGLTSISSALVSGERVWSFLPSAVSGVDATTPQTINIKYKYTDPATNCSNSSTRPVTVYFRPTAVPIGNLDKIQPGALPADKTIIQLCQNTTAPFSFSVSNAVTYNYRWYEGTVSPENLKGTSTSFVPPVNTATPGTYPFVITREINGCESITSNLSLQVNVIALPAAPVPNFSDAIRQYCVNTVTNSVDPTHLNVPGTNLTWYNSTGGIITPIADDNLPTPAELNLSTNAPQEYNFSVSQTETVNFCEGPKTPLKVTIKALPVVSVTAAPGQNPSKICTTGGLIRFIGRDLSDPANPAPNGTWTVSSSAGATNVFPTLGEVDLNPIAATPGDYTLQYSYTNSASCSNNGTINLTILPKLTPSVNIAPACLGAPSVFTINAGTPEAAVHSVSWDFGDGQQLPRDTASENIDPAIHEGKTTGIYRSPNHIYPSIGNFTAKGIFTTEDGCNYDVPSTAAQVYPMPKANFTSHGVCVDDPGREFRATSDIAIATYSWTFAKEGNLGDELEVINTSAPNILHSYSLAGTDIAQLIATTSVGCRDTVEKRIYSVPNLASINNTSTYTETFTTSKGGWIEGGRNLSWQWDAPTGAPTSSNGPGWNTSMDKVNESSWVLSGCFNFATSTKPVLSLDVWSDGAVGVDGAVIQYNYTGNIEDDVDDSNPDGDWITLGEVNSGINWYDAQGISNNPGNQQQISAGWTGKYSEWRNAIYKLDDLKPRNNVVFRIAFATNAPKRDNNNVPYTGFAFDNIFMGERNRIVLHENFTNSSGVPNSSGLPSTHNVSNYENFPTAGGSVEVVRVQYHTGFPGSDAINSLNKQMNNSRAAFYGITQAPNMRLDGDFGIGSIASWLTDSYDDRILTPAELKLNVTAVKVDGIVKINTSVENTTSQPISAVAERLNIFTVIVDELITDPDLLGNSGKSQFINVAREMLPSAAGVPISADIQPGPTNAYIADEIIWNKPNGTKVVVFVQKINDERKEVYQAAIVTPVGGPPDIVTGTEDPEYAERIYLYPNPANNEVNIQLPAVVNKPTPITLIDAFGRVVYQSVFQAGEQTKTVTTSTFADGIYMLQLAAPQGSKVVKKVMVTHR